MSSTSAPLVVKDKVIVGSAGGDSGMRGFVAALSAKNGDEIWRTYTVPAKGEPGAETWPAIRNGAAEPLGCPVRSILSPRLCIGQPVIHGPISRAPLAKATISTPARSSRSISIPAR